MKTKATLFVIALSGIGASCGTVSADLDDGAYTDSTEVLSLPPAPAGETAASLASPFTDLRTFDVSSIAVTGDNEVGGGRYVGNLVLDQKRTRLQGAGSGKTVIDGNLIVGSQCRVTGVTVTGDVIFTGNNARVNVECLGQVLDYGMQNRH